MRKKMKCIYNLVEKDTVKDVQREGERESVCV